ncbi:MAG: hypothetical protein A2V90_04800 [Gammaproteobacteria bacterium RBG_16_57_12]|nr:MAG: hypothetical protein A2V90_04800 [Gammaproteobacteria bacterium RBG_16_57_12]
MFGFEIIPNFHPIFVHFTVALIGAALLFMVLGGLFPRVRVAAQWRTAACWTLWLAGAMTVLTVAAGIYAFNTVVHDDVSHRVMITHRNWALLTTSVLVALVAWSIVCTRRRKPMGWGFLAAMFALQGLVSTTAWYGAELVYRHGIGVMALPLPSMHGHDAGSAHEHTEAMEMSPPDEMPAEAPATEPAHEDHDHTKHTH